MSVEVLIETGQVWFAPGGQVLTVVAAPTILRRRHAIMADSAGWHRGVALVDLLSSCDRPSAEAEAPTTQEV